MLNNFQCNNICKSEANVAQYTVRDVFIGEERRLDSQACCRRVENNHPLASSKEHLYSKFYENQIRLENEEERRFVSG